MTSAVVTDLDREVIIHTSMKFQSWIEVVMEATHWGFYQINVYIICI
jgi:hypothetical protein